MDPWTLFGTVVAGAQGAYNLYKDITGTDYDRSVEAGQDLQGSQFGYNMQALDKQQAFTESLFNKSMAYNSAEADKQYQRSLVASSAVRDALNKRLAGLNPAEVTGSSVVPFGAGSVTSPSAPGSPSVGSPSVTGGHYAGSATALAESQNLLASADKQRSEQKLTDLKAVNQIARDSADVQKSKSEAFRNYKSGHLSQAEYKKTLALLDDQENLLKSQAEYYEKTGAANESQAQSAAITAEANHMNALTAQARQAADQAYQRALTIIESDRVELQHRGIVIDEQKLMPIIANIAADIEKKKAEAVKLNEEAVLTSKDVANYDEKLKSALVLQAAQSAYYGFSGDVKAKELQYYDYYVYHNTIVKPIIDVLGTALLRKPSAPMNRTFNINVKPQQ